MSTIARDLAREMCLEMRDRNRLVRPVQDKKGRLVGGYEPTREGADFLERWLDRAIAEDRKAREKEAAK